MKKEVYYCDVCGREVKWPIHAQNHYEINWHRKGFWIKGRYVIPGVHNPHHSKRGGIEGECCDICTACLIDYLQASIDFITSGAVEESDPYELYPRRSQSTKDNSNEGYAKPSVRNS